MKKENLVVKYPASMGKKQRQAVLREKIKEIDVELEKLGVGDIKYRVSGTVPDIETNQNTINIYGITDVSYLFRQLAHYEQIVEVKKKFCTLNSVKDFILKNRSGHNISDIIHDLSLRILILSNQDKINVLNASKAKLLPFLDEDSRFSNALKEIDGLLNKLE